MDHNSKLEAPSFFALVNWGYSWFWWKVRVRSVPFSASRNTLFSVSYGENRRPEIIFRGGKAPETVMREGHIKLI